jgi:hypothetical protein
MQPTGKKGKKTKGKKNGKSPKAAKGLNQGKKETRERLWDFVP